MKEKIAMHFIQRIGKVNTEARPLSGFATAAMIEPQRGLKQAKGSILFVLDLNLSGEAAAEIGRTLMEVFEAAYYADPEEKVEESFEKGIKAVNEELKVIAEEGERSWIGKLSGVIAVAAGRKLLLTHRGTAEAYLLRGGRLSHLTEGLYTPGELPRPESTFIHVIDGEIKVGDKLLLSTAELFYFFSTEKLRKLLEEQSPASATRTIAEALKNEEDVERTNLLITEFTLPEMLALEDLEEESEVSEVIQAKKEAPSETLRRSPSKSVLKTPLDAAQVKEAVSFLEFASKTIAQLLKWFGLLLLTILDWVVGFITIQIARIKRRRDGNRILLGLAAALMIIVILGSINLGSGRGVTSARSASRALEQALQKQNAARAALIYEDRAQASTLLGDAYDLLQNASRNRRFKEAAAKQLTEVERQLDQLNNVKRVSLTTPLLDLNQLTQPVTGGEKPVSLNDWLVLNGDIYFLDSDNNRIYKYGSRTKEAAAINSLVSSERRLKLATALANNLFFYTNPPALYRLELASNKLGNVPLSEEGTLSSGIKLSSFGSTIYLLDPENSQIWRYRYQEKEANLIKIAPYFGEGKPDLKGALEMAIDGDIYILNNNQIQRFTSGAPVTFSLKEIPRPAPPLDQIKGIFTDSATSGLYLLDAANKRVVVFNKDGTYRGQYLLENDLPQAFRVDEANKAILLQAGSKIYKIEL